MAPVGATPRKKRSAAPDSESTSLQPLPPATPLRFIPTMQPKLVETAPSGDGWLHEIKYDGYRIQLHFDAGKVTAYTRNGHDWTTKFGPVINDARAIPARQAIIDGEMCVQDAAGVTDFAALPSAIRERPNELVCFVFDLLWLDGVDLRPAPIEERRAKLRFLINQVPGARIIMSDEYDGDGEAFFELVNSHGLEGMVSKRKGSRYWSGASTSWFKTKCWATATLEVIGVEKDKQGVPYAILADASGYKGAAFIGLPGDLRRAFWRYVESRGAPRPTVVGLKKNASWLKPGMTAQVRYLKGSDKLRHAVVQRVDIDQNQ